MRRASAARSSRRGSSTLPPAARSARCSRASPAARRSAGSRTTCAALGRCSRPARLPRPSANPRAGAEWFTEVRAGCWHDKLDVRVESVPEPKLLNPRDAIVRVTATAICGSDLHLYGGFVPGMVKGDILGHEFMGEVVDVGRNVKNLRPGDRVVVPFPIACGNCFFCQKEMYSLCENSNPNAAMAEKLWGYSPCGIYGYSHLLGGYAGGRGPDACIGAVGMEAQAYHNIAYAYDRMKQAMMLESDRPVALREAVMACRSGGTISIAGVYGGLIDKFPAGALMNRSLTIRTGQTHVQRYMRKLLARIEKGEIDPSFIISHRMRLEDAPAAYRMFRDKQDDCIKVVLIP